MKTTQTTMWTWIMAVVLALSVATWAADMGTAFTYQGRLLDDNIAADGIYDMQFKMYDDPNTVVGSQTGATIIINDVEVLDGYFITDLTKPLADDPEFDAWVKQSVPLRRWGDPSELVGAAVFLASSASNYVNGHLIYVDGGLLACV